MDPTSTPNISSIKLRIDTLTGKSFHTFSAIIVLLLGLIFLLASLAPDAYSTEYRSIDDCSTPLYNIPGFECKQFDLKTNPIFGVEVTDIGHRDKFIVLEISPLQLNTRDNIKITTQVTVKNYFVQLEETSTGTLLSTDTKDVVFDCSYSQEEPCTPQEIFIVPKIEARGYYFTVEFSNGPELSQQLSSFQVSTTSLSIPWRNFRFCVKFTFVAITALCLLAYLVKMSDLKKDYLSSEQKLLLFTAPSLLTVNEPFSIHLFEGVMYSWTTIFSFAIFSSLLIWFWILMLDNYAGSDSSLIEKSSTFAKLYTPLYFIVLFLTYGTLGHLSLSDSNFCFNDGQNWFFQISKYVLYGVLAIGVVWVVLKAVRISKRTNELTERENAFFWFSLFFILSHFYFMFRGNLYPFSYDSSGVILFNGVSTLYVFAAAYLFLPTAEGITQANYLNKYHSKKVKDSYKDLEESVVEKTPQSSNKMMPTRDTSEKGEERGRFEAQVVSLERNTQDGGAAAQQYPYEQKGEEDF